LVAKKKVVAVSSTEAFPMAGLALQVEVPTASAMAASITGLTVGDECWNSSLEAASIQLEAVLATSKCARLREIIRMTSRVFDPSQNPVT
jgi:hypothetical protein